MPNSVVGTPFVDDINLLGDPFCFEFTMTGVNSPTHCRRFGYQLCTVGNKPLSAIEVVTPKEGQSFPLNFKKDLETLISTPVPECLTQAIDDLLDTRVILKTWESVFDKETCKSEKHNEVTYGPYTILNSADQYHGPTSDKEDGFILMTCFPEYLKSCGCQMIYFYSIGDSLVEYVGYTDPATSSTINTLAAPRGVFSLAVDFEDYPNASMIEVKINGCTITTFVKGNCCCKERIAFQHSGGGYSFMDFDCVQTRAIVTKQSEACLYQNTKSTKVYDPSRLTTQGVSIINKSSDRLLTFTKVIEDDDFRSLKYYEDFLASGSYFYDAPRMSNYKEPTTKQLVKFIPNAGTLKYSKKDDCQVLTFTGKLNQPYNYPNYRV